MAIPRSYVKMNITIEFYVQVIPKINVHWVALFKLLSQILLPAFFSGARALTSYQLFKIRRSGITGRLKVNFGHCWQFLHTVRSSASWVISLFDKRRMSIIRYIFMCLRSVYAN